MPLVGRRVAAAEPGRAVAVLVVVVLLLEAETLGVLPNPPRTTLPLDVPRPLLVAVVEAARAFSCSSAFLAAASRRS